MNDIFLVKIVLGMEKKSAEDYKHGINMDIKLF